MGRILGVDPGTLATGWGIIDSSGRSVRHLGHGVIRTRAKEPLWERLRVIHDGLAEVIAEHRPEILALEECFVSRNVQSALKLGHTRGVVMVACTAATMDVFEYTASQVKSVVAGHGRARKHQVQEMVRVALTLPKAAPEDASDALAAAICHAHVGGFRAALRAAR
ncbi:MAG: crossover junction endodeoxyribonuclease RuvC [Myxococcota bacterium]